MKPIALFAGLLLAGAALAPTAASAWPYIDVVASEVLSVDPPRVKTTFELSAVGYDPPGLSYQFLFVYGSGPLPAPIVIEGTPAPGWFSESYPASEWLPPAVQFWHDGPFPKPDRLPFSIVTDREAPCVHFLFLSPLLAKSPSLAANANYELDACLVLDAPVPTTPTTWGSVKSTYR